jgi:hypothetical protein
MRVIVVFAFLVLSAAAGHAQPPNQLLGEPSDFLGTWNNVEIRRNMVVRIVIEPDYGRHVHVTVFGLRDGQPCKFGEYRGHYFVSHSPRDREQDNSAIMVRVERDFARGAILLRFNGRGEIVSHALLKFANGDNTYNVERFNIADHGYDRGYSSEQSYSEENYSGPGRPYYRGY